jgi:hypothetical protein
MRVLLSGFSAILIAWLMPWFAFVARLSHDSNHATGVDILSILTWRILLSPMFWGLSICLFVAFFAASRLRNKVARVVFFWTPAILTMAFACGLFSIAGYLWLLRFKGA